MNSVKMSSTKSPKEIYVKITNLASSKNSEFNLSRIKEEYDKEGSGMRNWNVFSGGGIGASVGLVACLATTVIGVPISSPEVFTIVCGSLLFGVIAGFILN